MGKKTSVRTIEELAERHGVEPGDFLMSRMAEIRKELAEMKRCIELKQRWGTIPLEEVYALYVREAADYVKLELEVMPYFYPKKRQVETEVSAEDSLIDVLRAKANGK